MSKADRITGSWKTNSFSGDLVISFEGKAIEGFYAYQDVSGRRAKAIFAVDSNGNGRPDVTDIVIGGFSAKTRFVTGGNIPDIAFGRFVADEDTGRFKLFYGSTKFASGSIFDPRDIFG
ncbi:MULTISPECIES: hypothetical protein [unclassified Cyanobium]|uniref:hypothetical protein n=1 Tax=unclassified Cyanobium TaxID=2627006 RepID=UPI0020CE800E|nr:MULTISPECIES: hypothetical protein [unclassified Cyanobium]MCP9777704.1 hypothetical protein [Cyanobium sp. Tous-M-B4]MCP9875394.1 hypothetical protein [Cyanobium sp. A2C-AMD]